MAFTFIIQNIAANLGGMLTPFGNPQNLYLYSRFNIPTGEFMAVMAIPFAAAVILMTLCCFVLKAEPIKLTNSERLVLPTGRTALYCFVCLFNPDSLSLYPLLARACARADRTAFHRQKGACDGRLSAALYLLLLFYLLGQYVAH